MLFLKMGGLSYTKVLRSLHNNTQQPVIYLVMARVLLLQWLLIWEKTAVAGLSPLLAILPQNNILACCAP